MKNISNTTRNVMIIIITVLCVIVAILILKANANNKMSNNNTHIPTFYLHGYAGTGNSMKLLVNSAHESTNVKDVVRAKVSKEGMVTFDGDIHFNAKRPVVDIILEDNTNKDLTKNAQWIRNAIIATMTQYHFEKFNFVAHSMGNQSFSYYMLNYGNDQHLPRLNKQVSLAGNFNGEVDINGLDLDVTLNNKGKPNLMLKDYKDLLTMKQRYPKDAQVLNIYGDINDGTQSDGRVTNVSSKALEYLLGDRIASYETFKVTGAKAEHSELHDNQIVIDKINAFLWEKSR
ncbi:alpha/beta hydrolase [Staphylococcus edaphicus]|uniref:Alpha/beta hydrolase n=1 Tax=Staphylococcus edaphicus TaxID=1955013 RepID=A0A2C6WP71_9STAP|nr:alpha/beta hydrolase [Staphylococcus edaphicus]PHK50179.1 alpha/beta hydrolase [Staphylococcus edaphicus]UQW82223.1 alpha/beta hydrolase [Staphylococcus edaphicus]